MKGRVNRSLAVAALLVVFASTAAAEVAIEFVKQPVEPLPGIAQYAVFVCNNEASPTRLSGGVVYRDASKQGISGVTRSALLTLARRRSEMSWQRRSALALEYGAWVLSGLVATEVVNVREDLYKAILPTGALSLRTITTAVKQREPTFEIPDDMLPPFVEVNPEQCAEHSFFGWSAP